MRDRAAINTITGYLYQFDYSILQILQLSNETDLITIEGVEDVDISELASNVAIQCKYYANTEYNHSEIARPIRLMLKDYKERTHSGKPSINYKLYGHYQKGQDKLPNLITVNFLKEHFLTYTHNKNKIFYYKELGLDDDQLQKFLSRLQIDINAYDYSGQLQKIFETIRQLFNCSDFEAEHYYYNNALSTIKSLAVKQDIEKRRICKKDFITGINKKEILFNLWFYYFRGEKGVFKNLRREYFSDFNMMPFERFFLIEVDRARYHRVELKDILRLISQKWSKLSKRAPHPFCPYVYIHNLEYEELVNLKNDLHQEGFHFNDGFPFKGSKFNPKAIATRADCSNQIKLKIIDELDFIESILSEVDNNKEVYQFYQEDTYFNMDNPSIKHVKIQVKKLRNIKEII